MATNCFCSCSSKLVNTTDCSYGSVCVVLYLYHLFRVFPQSFYRFNLFRNPVAAADIVHAATALTEQYGVPSYSSTLATTTTTAAADGTAVGADGHAVTADGAEGGSAVVPTVAKIGSLEAFNQAYRCLGMGSDALLHDGIQAALDLQKVSSLLLQLL